MFTPGTSRIFGSRGRTRAAKAVFPVLLLMMLLLLSWSPTVGSSDGPDLPPNDPAVGASDFHQVIITQGDDPDSTDKEPRNLVVISERTFWRVPWDSDEVYTYIPGKAENVFIDQVEAFEHQGQTFFIPGDYSASANPHSPPTFGRVGSGDYQGMGYWRFPEGADRTQRSVVSFAENADWEDMDTNLTDPEDWLIIFDSLSLDENVTQATYTSKRYTGGMDIVSINMTILGEYKSNMTFEVTWDNGTTWHPIVEGEPLPALGEGTEFRWRVTMTQNDSLNIEPIIDDAAFEVRFIPFKTEIWLEATYHIRVPSQGSAEMYLKFPFDGNYSGMILVAYFDTDMVLDVTGTTVRADPDEKNPGRTTYLHMQGAYEKVLLLTITDEGEAAEGNGLPAWVWFAVPMVIILLVAGAYLLRSKDREVGGDDMVETPADARRADEDLSERSELEQVKADILGEIAELDRQLDEGSIDDESHRVKRAELKAEAVEVMRQLESLD